MINHTKSITICTMRNVTLFLFLAETVAFWATRKMSYNMPNMHAYNISWPEVKLNIGNDYDVATGVFRCRIHGVYMFITSVDSNPPYSAIVGITHNGIVMCKAYASFSTDDTGTCTTIMKLSSGDEVYVSKITTAHLSVGGAEFFAYFSGILMSWTKIYWKISMTLYHTRIKIIVYIGETSSYNDNIVCEPPLLIENVDLQPIHLKWFSFWAASNCLYN